MVEKVGSGSWFWQRWQTLSCRAMARVLHDDRRLADSTLTKGTLCSLSSVGGARTGDLPEQHDVFAASSPHVSASTPSWSGPPRLLRSRDPHKGGHGQRRRGIGALVPPHSAGGARGVIGGPAHALRHLGQKPSRGRAGETRSHGPTVVSHSTTHPWTPQVLYSDTLTDSPGCPVSTSVLNKPFTLSMN